MRPDLLHTERKSETATEATRATRAAVALVYVHAGIFIIHGAAHARLHVALSTWAGVFVAMVIGIAPVAAIVLLKRGSRLKGAGTLATAMAASLLFGLWNHFFVHGGDHVAHVAGGPWRLPFQVTAGFLAVTEATGLIMALRLMPTLAYRTSRQSRRKANAEKTCYGRPTPRSSDPSACAVQLRDGDVSRGTGEHCPVSDDEADPID
jgi:hypothetical protein